MSLWRLLPLVALGLFGLALLVRLFDAPEELERLPPPPAELDARTFAPIPGAMGSERLTGRVLDRLDRPIEGAVILLDLPERPLWTESDAEGRFSIEGLPAGPWSGTLAHFLWRAREFDAVESDVELRLVERLESAPILPRVERDDLDGRLIRPPGSSAVGTDLGLSGFEVLLAPDEPEDLLRGALPRRARADADGRFTFEELAEARYRISVMPAWAQGARDPDLLLRDDGHVVFEGGSRVLNLRLRTGRLRGHVVDRDGEPVEGALIQLHQVSRPDFPWPPQVTDAAGAFELVDLQGGEVYALRARAGDLGAREKPFVPVGETVQLELELE